MGGNGSEAIDIRYLLSSIFFWIVCSLVILPLAALVAHIFRFGENAMAYLSSSLSFATAAAAGARAIYLRRKNALGTAAVTGSVGSAFPTARAAFWNLLEAAGTPRSRLFLAGSLVASL